MPFEFEKQEISDVILIKPSVFKDERGFFMETYKHSDFVTNGITQRFTQDNHSKSDKNILRGLHFQTNPKAQAKILRCLSGEIYDVAVDIRKNSSTYKKWVGAVLSEENKHQLYIPEGFAHGFLVLSESAEVAYKASDEYSPQHDAGIRWDDPEINVNWGIKDPLVSEKDKNLPFLKDIDVNF